MKNPNLRPFLVTRTWKAAPKPELLAHPPHRADHVWPTAP